MASHSPLRPNDFLKNLSLSGREDHRQQGGGYGGQDSFYHHPLCLAAHLAQLEWIADLLELPGQLARPARGKSHSGLITPLEEPRRSAREQREERQSPPAIKPVADQQRQDDQANEKLNDPGCQPLAPLVQVDIREAYFISRGYHDINHNLLIRCVKWLQ